jgi:hypothetical protein
MKTLNLGLTLLLIVALSAGAQAPADVSRLSPAQFNALPPDTKLVLAGKVLTKHELLARKQRNHGATRSWEGTMAAQESADLAADVAKLRDDRRTRILQARQTLQPELERLAQAASPGGAPALPPTRDPLQAKAAELLRDSRDPLKVGRAELAAKRLYQQLKGAPSK